MLFAEHGVFEVKVENNCLIVDATGPFNEELAKHYQTAIDKCIEQLEQTQWYQIIVLHQLSLFTPEAEVLLTQTLINRKQRGLTKSAVVLIDIEGKSLVTQQLGKIYQKIGIEHGFFESINQAQSWLTDS